VYSHTPHYSASKCRSSPLGSRDVCDAICEAWLVVRDTPGVLPPLRVREICEAALCVRETGETDPAAVLPRRFKSCAA